MIRKARITDVREMARLIEEFAKEGVMLHRPLTDLYDNIRDFYIYEEEGHILGTCALHVCWEDLGEIKSLAVRGEDARRGIGRRLAEACIEEARELALPKLFALTYQPAFFEKMGFTLIDKGILPHKVWGECVKCFKFPDCDEIAVMREL
ncbi:MAG: N-acetyltransferase [Deltaproteobacteria bacterium]|nr:N-acetyltransferase [Deltaproteobacteria bacterium]